MSASVAAALGAGIDQLLGEPPAAAHPVARFGAAMQRLEEFAYADRQGAGVLYAAAGVGAGVAAGLALTRATGPTVATIAATALCAAGRMLDHEALAVARHLRAGDLAAARARVCSLVGRDTAHLDEAELSRAVIESLAENGVDAVTSSLFWASLGGAPAVFAHRCANTLDAMVGHRTVRYQRFGRASARLDDVLNYVPARLTAAAVTAARPRRAAIVWRTVRRDAHRHPSPNGGVIEAAFAGALGVRLGGVNRYDTEVDDRGTLGDGPAPSAVDIVRAVELRRRATVWFAVAMVVLEHRARGTVRHRRERGPLGRPPARETGRSRR